MPSPRCSLIVPVHDGLKYLLPMLQTLRACTPEDAYELILSDDASDANTQEFLKEQLHWATLLLSDANKGFAATCNAGARVAKGDFLIFLNSDLEFKEGWLEQIIERAESDSKIGAVGCKLLYPDGTIQHGGVFLREDQLDRIPLIASHDHVGKPANDPEANQPSELLAVTAAAILVRREAFERVGGFDEAYFNGYEDVDLCLKIREAGWKVFYEPKCCLIHHESKSGAKRFAKSKANQRIFVERWHGKVQPEVLVSPYMEVGPYPKTAKRATPEKVRIIVPIDGNVAAAALTLESIFAARIGLYDEVIAVAPAYDLDAHRYFQLCEGHDDAFTSIKGTLQDATAGVTEDFIAIVEPGTVVTQGWLSRMIPWLRRDDVAAVGPMLSGVEGPQNAMACIQSGQSGAIFPNELSHAFAAAFRGQGAHVQSLDPTCLVTRTRIKTGQKSIVAKDVFVHREPRFLHKSQARIAA